ncbi:nucleopolyhedrovirus P10 family protein [Streptomyces sp. H27-D2]|uniref:nucleopolyhedrovirus P10 family protein n=1 Tax=Streptomyces sp. H27-D2 TaxID=3046304 RepID=UPI002DB9D17F|nr:nucleopolyhedrovirus P10 family protein [Streptomyces sp. H27-D2]MEC4017711.1 nucleopolyhedrovirus P10 family protein [Streptomyces sp. H27-D2]
MAVDRLTQAVRQQLGLGRLLPLGDAADGSWLTEHAAGAVLRRSGSEVGGARLGALRIGPDDSATPREPAVPPPASALPPGPLRIEAECAVTPDHPVPATADRLREALLDCARQRLGLRISGIDLRVTGLLTDKADSGAATDTGRPATTAEPPEPPEPPQTVGTPDAPGSGTDSAASDADGSPDPAAAASAAAESVPGVTRLAPALGGLNRAVRVEEREDGGYGPAGRHVQVQLAVAAGHRALDVARAVRTAVAEALRGPGAGPVTVAVLVTAVATGE